MANIISVCVGLSDTTRSGRRRSLRGSVAAGSVGRCLGGCRLGRDGIAGRRLGGRRLVAAAGGDDQGQAGDSAATSVRVFMDCSSRSVEDKLGLGRPRPRRTFPCLEG